MTQIPGEIAESPAEFNLDGAVAELAQVHHQLRHPCGWCGGRGGHEGPDGAWRPCAAPEGCGGKGWQPLRDNLTDAALAIGQTLGDWVVANSDGRWSVCLLARHSRDCHITRFVHGRDLKTLAVQTLLAAHRGDWR